jgi:YidC/Oxa1 family membrane protein insertase
MKVGFANGITAVHLVTLVLIIFMTATLFITQLQLMRKNMPAEALTGPFAQQQKLMLYLFPIIFAIGGINFPVGVLIYWFASNLWTMGQQFYVIRRNPAPGTPAYDAWEERRKAKGKDLHEPIVSDLEAEAEAAGTSVSRVIRQQPRKQTRSQRKV